MKRELIHEIGTDSVLLPWFQQLSRLCNQYEKETGDLLWWWLERPLVSALATSAWALGWPALQEYADERTKGYLGRTDLWIKPHANPNGCAAEIKFTWLKRVKPKKKTKKSWSRKRLRSAWHGALESARKIPKTKEYSRRYAILIAAVHGKRCPSEESGDYQSWVDAQIRMFRENLEAERNPPQFIAAHFSDLSSKMISPRDKLWYPGFVIAARKL